jgi:hypothetical protein
MAISELYSSRELIATINDEERIPTNGLLLTGQYFNTHRTHMSRYIDIQVTTTRNGLAKYRRLEQEAAVVKRAGGKVIPYKIPYISEKEAVTAEALLNMSLFNGITLPGNQTPQSIRDRELAGMLQDLKDRNVRRREWQAMQLLTAGRFTYDEDGLSMDLELAGLDDYINTLSGTDLWTDAASDPGADARRWARLIGRSGGKLDRVYLGEEAAAGFRNNTTVQADLARNNTTAGRLDLDVNASYLGTIYGADWYEYNAEYTTDGGVDTPYLPVDGALAIGSNFLGETYFGLVPEVRTVFAGEYFVKSKEEFDPSVEWLLVKSSPLCLPRQAGTWVYETVV